MIAMPQFVLMLVIGLVTGVFSGVFGIGGGIIIVPILVFVLNFSQVAATGTSLVALLLPVGILGVYEYYRSGRLGTVEIKAGLLIAVGLFFGVYLGAKVSALLPENILRKGFSVFLVLVAAKLWLKS